MRRAVEICYCITAVAGFQNWSSGNLLLHGWISYRRTEDVTVIAAPSTKELMLPRLSQINYVWSGGAWNGGRLSR